MRSPHCHLALSCPPLWGKSLLPAGRRPHPLPCLLTFAATAKSRDTCACQHSGASHFLFLPAHFSRSMSDQGNPILHVPTFDLKTELLLSKINSVYRQDLEKRPLEMDKNFPGLTAASPVSAPALEPWRCWPERKHMEERSALLHNPPPPGSSFCNHHNWSPSFAFFSTSPSPLPHLLSVAAVAWPSFSYSIPLVPPLPTGPLCTASAQALPLNL